MLGGTIGDVRAGRAVRRIHGQEVDVEYERQGCAVCVVGGNVVGVVVVECGGGDGWSRGTRNVGGVRPVELPSKLNQLRPASKSHISYSDQEY